MSWEGVPEVQGRADKGSGPHGGPRGAVQWMEEEDLREWVDVLRGMEERGYGLKKQLDEFHSFIFQF